MAQGQLTKSEHSNCFHFVGYFYGPVSIADSYCLKDTNSVLEKTWEKQLLLFFRYYHSISWLHWENYKKLGLW
jgi:hypothetical protein